jgi:colicin import membrane protein
MNHRPMNHRPLSVAFRLIALLALSAPVLAGESGPTPEQLADWQQRLDQAAALQAESKAVRSAADEVLEAKNIACYKKFLVNACQRDARREHVVSVKEARRLETEAKLLERAVKKEERIDKDQRAAELAPKREAELEVREAEVKAEREAAAERTAEALANKARKAEEGSQRKAAEAEKYRKKQEAHDAKVAEKMNEAARRSVESATPSK